ncbi:MAG: hypothetical protein IJX74_07265 [Clostridia bacterium]|nr:hypothetical protein [Clostridia bacterium]
MVRDNEYDSGGELCEYTLYENNEKGQAIKVSWYFGNGESDGFKINEYNDLDQISKTKWYLPDGEEDGYATYEYDEDGNKIKIIGVDSSGNKSISEYNSGGMLLQHKIEWVEGNFEISEYDDNENEIRRTFVWADSSKSVAEYEYDEDGNKAKSVIRYYDENGTHTYTDTELYNENGYVAVYESIEHFPDAEDVINKSVYDLDGDGLIIKETCYYNGELEEIINYTYNEYGQEISSVEVNADGETEYTTKREYYDNGNMKSYIIYCGVSDVMEEETYYYESGGVKIWRVYNVDGELSWEYFYDEDGNTIEELD